MFAPGALRHAVKLRLQTVPAARTASRAARRRSSAKSVVGMTVGQRIVMSVACTGGITPLQARGFHQSAPPVSTATPHAATQAQEATPPPTMANASSTSSADETLLVDGEAVDTSLFGDWSVEKAMNEVLTLGLDGSTVMSSSNELAASYVADPSYKTTAERVNALIKTESAKGFGSGFVTGVGGMLVLPVGLPAAVFSSWILQARLAGAVAVLHGQDLSQEKTRALALISLLAETGSLNMSLHHDAPKDASIGSNQLTEGVGLKFAREFLTLRAPMMTMVAVKRAVGARLAKAVASRGMARAVPVVGGLVGGAVDAHTLFQVGQAADKLFTRAAIADLKARASQYEEAEAANTAAETARLQQSDETMPGSA